jgi:hypothetical protein
MMSQKKKTKALPLPKFPTLENQQEFWDKTHANTAEIDKEMVEMFSPSPAQERFMQKSNQQRERNVSKARRAYFRAEPVQPLPPPDPKKRKMPPPILWDRTPESVAAEVEAYRKKERRYNSAQETPVPFPHVPPPTRFGEPRANHNPQHRKIPRYEPPNMTPRDMNFSLGMAKRRYARDNPQQPPPPPMNPRSLGEMD